MSFIREHACDGIGVDDVLDHLTVSRSTLQRLFRNELGRTILEAITAVQDPARQAASHRNRPAAGRRSPIVPATPTWSI